MVLEIRRPHARRFVRPSIDGTYSFEQAAEAQGRLEYGKNIGKVILTP